MAVADTDQFIERLPMDSERCFVNVLFLQPIQLSSHSLLVILLDLITCFRHLYIDGFIFKRIKTVITTVNIQGW